MSTFILVLVLGIDSRGGITIEQFPTMSMCQAVSVAIDGLPINDRRLFNNTRISFNECLEITLLDQ